MHNRHNDNELKPKADLFGLLFYRTVNLSSQRKKFPHTAISKPQRGDTQQVRKIQ